MATRRFTCADCGHTFEVDQGAGMERVQMICPQCGGTKIHRAKEDHRDDRLPGPGNVGHGPAGGGRSRDQTGRGRGRIPGHGHR